LPIEVFLIVGYFFFQNIASSRNKAASNNILNKISFSHFKSKKFLKISIFLILPWLSVFSFYFSYNDYYFGDPFTSYYASRGLDSKYLLSSFLIFDADRFDSIKYYSIVFLPDLLGYDFQINSPNTISENVDNLLLIFSFVIIIFALAISIYDKFKRTEVLVFIFFISGILLFYSTDYATTIGKDSRFMIPAITFTFILFAYINQRILKINFERFPHKYSKFISYSFKTGFFNINCNFSYCVSFGNRV